LDVLKYLRRKVEYVILLQSEWLEVDNEK